MSQPRDLVCVFAGAHTPKSSFIMKRAAELGRALGEEGFDILYGGGGKGVMGAVTEAAHEAGANIHAILLHRFMGDVETLPVNVLHAVENEYQRMELFDDPRKIGEHIVIPRPVAYFALPGGSGTLRETAQGIENAIYNNGPRVYLAGGRYQKGLRKDFQRSVKEGLISEEKAGVLQKWKPGQSIRAMLEAGPR